MCETGAPIRVLAGYLGHVTVSVPWSALLTDSCRVEIAELSLTVAPHLRQGGEGDGEYVWSVYVCVWRGEGRGGGGRGRGERDIVRRVSECGVCVCKCVDQVGLDVTAVRVYPPLQV